MPAERLKSDALPYRVATVDDIPLLVDLINRAYVAEAAIIHGLRTDRLDLHTKIAAPNTWFLVFDEPSSDESPALAGCVCLDCDGHRGHIGLLSVNPEAQGRGLGAQLLRAAEAHCQQQMCCPIMELDVVSVRHELFGFYEHMGFVRTGELPFPQEARLKQPAHLVTMQKPAVNPARYSPTLPSAP